jgi:hypothetical protein
MTLVFSYDAFGLYLQESDKLEFSEEFGMRSSEFGMKGTRDVVGADPLIGPQIRPVQAGR